MFGSDVLSAGMAVPSDESGFLISHLPAEVYTLECLCASAEFEPPNNGPNPAGSGVVELPVVAQSEPATVDLKPFFLAVILLGGLCHFLTSPYYAAFWNRLFGPLDWD
ncbi:MAG TPA: hypothetical protein VNY05_26890 [Candidatus Acidoferrales bacterium]|nr:hypothetical protein [Candidatus Acidoferrales bacterium]